MTGTEPYKDTSLTFAERARDLVSRMTLAEKAAQMNNHAPAIERLGVPQYDYWNECLHGVARAGTATVFPQAIGLAATWNAPLLGEIADCVSTEGRAKHHAFTREGKRGIYQGLTFWTPNINIFRDPRWGRGQETYGEDPYLTGRLGVAFVQGLQGDDDRYLKAAACAKHFAVHSGPEADRHGFDAKATPRDMWDTYLPAFKDLVKEAGVESVMGAYNRTNGEACCASPTLLGDVLRGEWGFQGHVVSDCGAICDIWKHHRVVRDPDEAAALAVNNGCDLCCGDTYQYLVSAVEKGYITEEAIDTALTRLLVTRFKLGMFDPDDMNKYSSVPKGANDSPANRTLALRASRESMVLLKNDGLLPLRPDAIRRLAVVGPNADDIDVLLGNYNGTPSSYTTPLEGLRRKLPYATVAYARGCGIQGDDRSGFDEALEVARSADAVVAVMGLSPRMEGEEGDSQGDRASISLPGVQEELLKLLHATGVPVVLVLMSGSAVAANWADENLPAVLQAWYPGQDGGTAIADTLFGDNNPGGRLPVTFYRSEGDLPDFTDYSMDGRTYRYFGGDVLYPFGWGLSYTRFAYSRPVVVGDPLRTGEPFTVNIDVTNTGGATGDEVVQLYITRPGVPQAPIRSLRGFRRTTLSPGETATVSFTVMPEDISVVDESGRRWCLPGEVRLSIGGCQPGAKWTAAGNRVVEMVLDITGEALELLH